MNHTNRVYLLFGLQELRLKIKLIDLVQSTKGN